MWTAAAPDLHELPLLRAGHTGMSCNFNEKINNQRNNQYKNVKSIYNVISLQIGFT